MKFNLTGEIRVEPPVQGPWRPRGFSDHKWRLSASTDGLVPHVSLTCEDPCSIPYYGGKLCCCVWATDGDSIDIGLDDLPVTITHEDHSGYDAWTGEYEPGWLKLTPTKEDK